MTDESGGSRPAWETQLAIVDELMRNVSRQTDPQELVNMYGEAVTKLYPTDQYLALSRRGLEPPYYRITRNSRWEEDINPWTQRNRLPVFSGGILGEWMYADRPLVIQNFEIDETDPHYELLKDVRSVAVMPHYDNGVAINLSIMMFWRPNAVAQDDVPSQLWRMNLFGRTTHNLVLRKELAEAYDAIDRELRVVGDIQRSLLPSELPEIPSLQLAAHYRTSQRAGGDYYDLFPLAKDRWGLFIADVSGHGTPAAVMMAVTHALAHTLPGSPESPDELLHRLNRVLHDGYTRGNGTFVTAFYAIYDAAARTLRYSSAGHNPPRLWRNKDQQVESLDGAGSLPLGVLSDVAFTEERVQLAAGDALVLYTDGIVEALDRSNRMFGVEGLDAAIEQGLSGGATGIIEWIQDSVGRFTGQAPARDDETVLVGVVR